MRKRFMAGLLAAVLLTGCACGAATQEASYTQKSAYTIGVLLKSMNHQHWMDVRSGALDAGRELNVQVILLHPEYEDSIEQQKEMFLDLVNVAPDAILFAPCDSEDCLRFVNLARAKGIEVIALDSRPNDVELPYIGADNVRIGELAAERMLEVIGGAGKVAILSGYGKQASHQERVQGFTGGLKGHAGVEIVSIKYANSDFYLAIQGMEEILQETPDIAGVFCTSAAMALGAIEQKKRSAHDELPVLVAVDTQDDALNAIKQGALQGLASQDGYEAGYMAVYRAVELIKGSRIPDNTYISLDMITIDNIDAYIEQRTEKQNYQTIE